MLKLYNTLTRKKEVFIPLNKNKVKMFVCGPTVYDYSHIGHAKTYIQFDVIARYLRYKKYNLFYLQNITDIDDRIINRAKELKKDPLKLANEYEKYYYEDIKEIISQIKRLIKLGYVYKISDGYYFDLSKFKEYGKLSGRTTLEAEDSVTRIDDSKEKRNKGDFCLWKFYKENEPYWECELGKGRPGWHIEDTAITEKEFGQQYDIHGGARDLIFPHHEAEIAQMESISKKELVKYWIHTGFLTVKNEKMSKSVGNFITIRDALEKYSPEVLRMFMINAHYRHPINFDEINMEQAKNNVEKINNFLIQSKNSIKKIKDNKEIKNLTEKLKKDFLKEMNDDINTPKVVASLFNFMNKVNRILIKGISKNDFNKVNNIVLEMNKIFDIIVEKEKIPKEISRLADERERARKKKDFSKADQLRKEINDKGYSIDDTSSGYILKEI
jgi:cysteinyl-tRNA synthetase